MIVLQKFEQYRNELTGGWSMARLE